MSRIQRTPEIIDRLVKYICLMSKDYKHVSIKPCKAFKECKSFCATIIFTETDINLNICCDNIASNYYNNGEFRLSLFKKKLKFEDPDDIIKEIHLGISKYKPSSKYEPIIRQIVVDALDTLDNITFSIADGKFHMNSEKLPGTEYKEIMNELWCMDEDLECSVCLEKTVTETPCGHRLCIPCWSIINETKPRCPICREKIDFYDDEESEESDSESD